MTHSSIVLQEKIADEINTSPSFQAHLIEVTQNDLDFGLILQKGLCAVLPVYVAKTTFREDLTKTIQGYKDVTRPDIL